MSFIWRIQQICATTKAIMDVRRLEHVRKHASSAQINMERILFQNYNIQTKMEIYCFSININNETNPKSS